MPQEAQLGSLQRKVTALTIDADDAFAYAGTTSGDVLQARGARRRAGQGGAPLERGDHQGACSTESVEALCLL